MSAILGVVVLASATAWLTAAVVLWLAPAATRSLCFAAVLSSGVASAWVAQLVWLDRPVILAVAGTVGALALVSLAYSRRRVELSAAGATAWVTWLLFGLTTLAWAVLFLAGLSLSTTSTVLLWAAVAVATATMPSAIVTTREGWQPLLRRSRRPDPPHGAIPLTGASPRVSIHVPCHAEPPDVVIGTLNRLADLEYDNYEVLVIDNNTTDPNLWRPVQEHCARLGERFRFFHVEGLTGAKAGALNWALLRTDPRAVLIGVVDADYHVEPSWLRETVGYFENRAMGFVQCPHAYRDYDRSRFATWANWEYSVFFQTGMVSLDEHGAGLTVGTMSLIRKQALNDAGGWAEWCLTEDSELSIRIHAAGYESIYLTEAYGRGLVPETFEAYRRQRFRWTFGPVQEFRHHRRLFLPRWLGGTPSRLNRTQRLHHANHGIDVMGIGARGLALVLGVTAALSLIVHGETVLMPFELWAASTSALLTSWAMRLMVYRRVVGARIGQGLGAITAFAALSMVITIASVRATLGFGSAWHRTNKFRASRNWRTALAAASAETTLAVVSLGFAGVLALLAPQRTGVVTMLAIALAAKGVAFLAAPLLALLADRDLPGASDLPGPNDRSAPVVENVAV